MAGTARDQGPDVVLRVEADPLRHVVDADRATERGREGHAARRTLQEPHAGSDSVVPPRTRSADR